MDSGPFHAGELAMQERAGSRQRLAESAPRGIRDHMPDQHRELFEQLPFLLAGSVDAQGQPWASVLAGPPGFVRSPDPRLLRVDARPLPHDPLAFTLRGGMAIGLLGIQPHTRRRNRMNGRVVALDAEGFAVQVGQSFGNCPKYITPREARYAPGPESEPEGASSLERLKELDEEAQRLLARADTFFLATAHPAAEEGWRPALGVDISHRGGPAGFVRVEDERRLCVPDFVGNAFFMTLGNLHLYPRCGLLFIDFASGDRLYLAARAELEWEGPGVRAIEGAQRLMHLELTEIVRVRGALPLRWTAP